MASDPGVDHAGPARDEAPGALTLLQTSPRVPAGLLTGAAWRALATADEVLASDPQVDVVAALRAEGIVVHAAAPDATALLASAAGGRRVVWLEGPDDDTLVRAVAAAVVARAEHAPPDASDPDVEVLVGSYDSSGARLLDLVEVMDRLRRECPWDREQTHESLVRYLVEESYETIEAIESGDRGHLREELGDLLLQVLFHARMASEDPDEPFDIDDVAAGIVEKLIRRHPHVFADADADDAETVEANWESIKSAEKGRGSAMDGIPPGLPALSWADKVVGRAVKGTLPLSVPTPDEPAYDAETLGEVLFALVAAAHAAGIDPEQALRYRVRQEMTEVRASEQRASTVQPDSRG